MQQIPINPVPQQSLNIVLANQNVSLNLYTLTDQYGSSLYADVSIGAIVLKSCIRCINLARWLVGLGYLGFIGDFVIVDTQGNDEPQYTGLGTRWVLIYLDSTTSTAGPIASSYVPPTPPAPPTISGYVDTFIATAGQTVFTLSHPPQYISNVDLSLDGATLTASVDFTLAGTTLTLINGALAGQRLTARYYA